LQFGIENVVEYVTEKNYTGTYSIYLSDFRDDLFEWETLKVQTEVFGRFDYFNGSTKAENISDEFQILDYNPNKNTLDFIFSSWEQFQKFWGLHTISLSLTDKRGAWSTYYPNITFVEVQEPEKIVEPTRYNPLADIDFRIESMDKFGNTVLKFSKPMHTSGIELNEINSTVLDVYIEPFIMYHLEYEDWNMTKLNFTWHAKEFKNDTLKLKIDFFEPHWISS
jgi:hypothetical protein